MLSGEFVRTVHAVSWFLKRQSLRHILCCVALLASVLLAARPAAAFENQWHLGAGLGVADYDRGTKLGPALGLHGAYGMSDCFDARLELMSSLHGSDPLSLALLGITYKLDIIQLIPWGGVAVGGYYLGKALAVPGRSSVEPGVAALFGFDYAWSRQWGASLAIGLHMLPFAEDRTPIALRYATAMLRLEHRWGW
jgi:hypothetical protein